MHSQGGISGRGSHQPDWERLKKRDEGTAKYDEQGKKTEKNGFKKSEWHRSASFGEKKVGKWGAREQIRVQAFDDQRVIKVQIVRQGVFSRAWSAVRKVFEKSSVGKIVVKEVNLPNNGSFINGEGKLNLEVIKANLNNQIELQRDQIDEIKLYRDQIEEEIRQYRNHEAEPGEVADEIVDIISKLQKLKAALEGKDALGEAEKQEFKKIPKYEDFGKASRKKPPPSLSRDRPLTLYNKMPKLPSIGEPPVSANLKASEKNDPLPVVYVTMTSLLRKEGSSSTISFKELRQELNDLMSALEGRSFIQEKTKSDQLLQRMKEFREPPDGEKFRSEVAKFRQELRGLISEEKGKQREIRHNSLDQLGVEREVEGRETISQFLEKLAKLEDLYPIHSLEATLIHSVIDSVEKLSLTDPQKVGKEISEMEIELKIALSAIEQTRDKESQKLFSGPLSEKSLRESGEAELTDTRVDQTLSRTHLSEQIEEAEPKISDLVEESLKDIHALQQRAQTLVQGPLKDVRSSVWDNMEMKMKGAQTEEEVRNCRAEVEIEMAVDIAIREFLESTEDHSPAEAFELIIEMAEEGVKALPKDPPESLKLQLEDIKKRFEELSRGNMSAKEMQELFKAVNLLFEDQETLIMNNDAGAIERWNSFKEKAEINLRAFDALMTADVLDCLSRIALFEEKLKSFETMDEAIIKEVKRLLSKLKQSVGWTGERKFNELDEYLEEWNIAAKAWNDSLPHLKEVAEASKKFKEAVVRNVDSDDIKEVVEEQVAKVNSASQDFSEPSKIKEYVATLTHAYEAINSALPANQTKEGVIENAKKK